MEEGKHQEPEEEVPPEENKGEDSDFEGDERIVKDTGIKLVMQSDVVAPQVAKKSTEWRYNHFCRGRGSPRRKAGRCRS